MHAVSFIPGPDGDPIGALASWIDALLSGSAITVIAGLATAGLGFQLLSGTLDIRRALRLVVGLFVLFGASGIASGLMARSREGSGTPAPLQIIVPPPRETAPITPPPPRFDPYAGASVPHG